MLGPGSTGWPVPPRQPSWSAVLWRETTTRSARERRTSPAQYGQVQVSPSKERRIRSFAAWSGCKPRVALEALLDFALSAAGEPGVSASQVEDITAALAELRYILEGVRAQLLAL